jgi:hypothetical protein
MKTNTADSDRNELLGKLTEDGRRLFDRLQNNLTVLCSSSDEELQKRGAELDEMFGGQVNDPEHQRDESRREQDKLDCQGREAFAAEYAETQIKNMVV